MGVPLVIVVLSVFLIIIAAAVEFPDGGHNKVLLYELDGCTIVFVYL